MKLFYNKIYILCFLAMMGCSSSKNNDSMTQRERNFLELLPPGAKNIKIYDKTLNGHFGWIKWEFEGECFLSCNLRNYQAVLTKVDCK